MPMNPVSLTPIVYQNLISTTFSGVSLLQLSSGIATGLSQYATTGIKVQSVDVGTLGAGKGTGLGVIISPSIIPSMIGSFTTYSMNGIFSIPMATAIANAFIQSFALAIINTINPTVGVGSGIIILIPNSALSTTIFFNGLLSTGMNGSYLIQLASAIANGLDQALPSSSGFITIAGPPSIQPSTGSGSGFLM